MTHLILLISIIFVSNTAISEKNKSWTAQPELFRTAFFSKIVFEASLFARHRGISNYKDLKYLDLVKGEKSVALITGTEIIRDLSKIISDQQNAGQDIPKDLPALIDRTQKEIDFLQHLIVILRYNTWMNFELKSYADDRAFKIAQVIFSRNNFIIRVFWRIQEMIDEKRLPFSNDLIAQLRNLNEMNKKINYEINEFERPEDFMTVKSLTQNREELVEEIEKIFIKDNVSELLATNPSSDIEFPRIEKERTLVLINQEYVPVQEQITYEILYSIFPDKGYVQTLEDVIKDGPKGTKLLISHQRQNSLIFFNTKDFENYINGYVKELPRCLEPEPYRKTDTGVRLKEGLFDEIVVYARMEEDTVDKKAPKKLDHYALVFKRK